MNLSLKHCSRLLLLSCSFILLPALSAFAQGSLPAKIQLNLDKLASKAAESVNVNLDGSMLQLASRFLSSRDPDEAKVKELIAGLKGVYVRSYTFDQRGDYSEADIELIRQQLKGPGWSRIVDVRSRRDDNVEVYTLVENGNIGGLAILSYEPRELTVVNIVGPIDLDKLISLEGRLGIPRFELEPSRKPRRD